MTLLCAGLALWIVVHLVPAAAPGVKARVVARIGAGRYRGLFALLVLAGLALIVIGWRQATPTTVYVPPAWGSNVTFPLMFVSVLLFGAARAPTNVKRILRHPQLTGLVVWSIAHLASNGDSRSVTLFVGLAMWALVEIPLLNRRDGAWVKPAPVARRSDLITVAISAVVFVALILLHPYFTGVKPTLAL